MSIWTRMRSTWRALRASDPGTDMDEEFSDHIARRAADLARTGLSEGAALRRARVEFGSLERYREEGREARGLRGLDEIVQDVRYGARVLLRSPLFSVVAIVTLAVGVGATTAVFGAVRGVLLQPLPYPDADALVVPRTRDMQSNDEWTISFADYEMWREAGVFAHVGVYREIEANVAGVDTPERVDALQVSDGFFPALGVVPHIGSTFAAEDFGSGSGRRAVISHAFWQRHFGGDPGVIGTTLRIGGNSFDVIGVLPSGGGYPEHADLWLPLRMTAEQLEVSRRVDNYVFVGLARLAPGRTLEATRERLGTLAAAVERAAPVARRNVTVTAVPLNHYIVGQNTSRALWVFLSGVGLVLLIGCVNLANLLMARAATRGRELAIRGSIGASRARIARQLFTESLLLGAAGGVAGALIAWIGTRALIRLAPANTPRLHDVQVDVTVMVFALAIALTATLIFGLVPALRASRQSVASALLESDRRSTTSRRGRRERNVLVAAELALSLVLLVGAGLQLRSLAQLRATDPGFATHDLITLSVSMQGERFVDPVRGEQLRSLLEGVRAIPGVDHTAAASSLPLGADGLYLGRAFLAQGRAEPPVGQEVLGQWVVATPGYFVTMGIPVVRGREFLDSDGAATAPVVIVNREFARRMFPDEDPIGRRVRSWRDENIDREIVGVTDDVRFFAAGDSIRPIVYVPHMQDAWSAMVIAVRTAAREDAIIPAIRAAVRESDPDMAIDDVQRMEQVHADSVAPVRFSAFLLSALAAIALLLAVVGTYGVFAYGVSQRRREIGIRLALGARSSQVLAMVLREALLVASAGIAIGTVAALVLSRLLRALLYNVSPTDPVVFVGVPALLAAVALAASLVPARQAAAIDPNRTIRVEG